MTYIPFGAKVAMPFFFARSKLVNDGGETVELTWDVLCKEAKRLWDSPGGGELLEHHRECEECTVREVMSS